MERHTQRTGMISPNTESLVDTRRRSIILAAMTIALLGLGACQAGSGNPPRRRNQGRDSRGGGRRAL